MSLQLLFGPTLAYNVDVAKIYMKISSDAYFSYAIPAVVSFILGLHITSKRLQGEVIDIDKIKKYVASHQIIPFLLIGIGFTSSLVSNQFSSDLAFVFYLLGGLKFIGVFMILLGNQN
ncbi:MAG: hypothetical protein IPL54_11290 [Chitinophagaceae bacterium]|nr:hypothetical protein [Chitinophagaceae bacterium]